MPRAALKQGDLVRLTAPGLAAIGPGHRLTADHVLKIVEVVPWRTYARGAFSLQCGADFYVLWSGHVKLLRRRPQTQVKCSACDGDGFVGREDESYRKIRCNRCDGTGYRERKRR